jgi:RsiW-degrading membrane proteinase PrsW (M82 family)
LAVLLVLVTPVVALAASLTVIYAIRFLDVIEREQKRMILLALLIGSLTVIPVLALSGATRTFWLGIASGDQSLASSLSTVIGAPVSEELAKGIGLLVLFRAGRHKFDSLTDYIVYGCAIGIGFELIENILYQWAALADSQPVASWLDEFNARMLASAGSHAFFSAWLGVALWFWNQGRGWAGAAWAAGAASLSVLLHAANNLAAVLTQLGSGDTVTPLNRLGTSLAVIGDQISLALFVGLIGVAVLRDAGCLSQFGSEIQCRLMAQSSEIDQARRLAVVHDLTNPFNHLFSRSSGPRSCYRRFSRWALAAARTPADSRWRNHLVDEGVDLVLSVSNS